MGCPSAELMTSSLHSDVRIAGLAFDVALHDSLAEICITLSRILQVQCKWWNTGVSHCTTSEKNVHYGACAYGFFFHFLPSCSIQTFIYTKSSIMERKTAVAHNVMVDKLPVGCREGSSEILAIFLCICFSQDGERTGGHALTVLRF